jgi:hypothetical protein
VTGSSPRRLAAWPKTVTASGNRTASWQCGLALAQAAQALGHDIGVYLLQDFGHGMHVFVQLVELYRNLIDFCGDLAQIGKFLFGHGCDLTALHPAPRTVTKEEPVRLSFRLAQLAQLAVGSFDPDPVQLSLSSITRRSPILSRMSAFLGASRRISTSAASGLAVLADDLVRASIWKGCLVSRHGPGSDPESIGDSLAGCSPGHHRHHRAAPGTVAGGCSPQERRAPGVRCDGMGRRPGETVARRGNSLR